MRIPFSTVIWIWESSALRIVKETQTFCSNETQLREKGSSKSMIVAEYVKGYGKGMFFMSRKPNRERGGKTIRDWANSMSCLMSWRKMVCLMHRYSQSKEYMEERAHRGKKWGMEARKNPSTAKAWTSFCRKLITFKGFYATITSTALWTMD